MHISSRQAIFLQHVAQTSDMPLLLEIDRAEGMYLYNTAQQKKYMDLIAGISVSTLGHCYPSVVQAVQKQAQTYMHLMVYGEYVCSSMVQLAELLCKQLPPHLNNVYFVNSGAEAVEGAMKLAKRYTQRPEIVSFKNAYHGSTQGALSIMGSEVFKQAYRPLLPFNKLLTYNNFEDIKKITTQTAAVIVEPLQAEAGAIVPMPNFLEALRQRCNETNTLLIFDEIQTGYGRTGSLFAFEQYPNAQPDVLLLAKGFGGGLPLGAFITNKSIMNCLQSNPFLGHITTFGGNAVCCAAALATLQVLLNTTYIQEVPQKYELFKRLLVDKTPKIKNLRGKGLLLALEFEDFECTKKVMQGCLQEGLITDWFLFADNCLRIAPPLIISPQEIEHACNIILNSTQNI